MSVDAAGMSACATSYFAGHEPFEPRIPRFLLEEGLDACTCEFALRRFCNGARRWPADHVLGADLTIKISSRDTGGAFTVFEGRTRPQEGPPLHRHRDQDEWWYIVEGEYLFEVDGQEIHACAGATVFAPRGSRHTFQNIGAVTGRTVTTVVPGGVEISLKNWRRPRLAERFRTARG